MRRNNKKGFTIVELVIVIAVIAILAAVLIPTFSSVVENAKESAALQEVKNAYTTYLSETLEDNAAPDEKIKVQRNSIWIKITEGKAEVAEEGEDLTAYAEYKFTAEDSLEKVSS